MNLLETLKKPFLSKEKLKNPSSEVKIKDTILDLTDNEGENIRYTSFFDSRDDDLNRLYMKKEGLSGLIERQKNYIQKYRVMAMNPDISTALDEIVNETLFTFDGSLPVQIIIEEENQKIRKAIEESFNKVVKLMNLQKNLFGFIKMTYVDGQMNVHLTYNKDKISDGIQKIKLIDPRYFYFDHKKEVFRYASKNGYGTLYRDEDAPELMYSPEEIVHGDFGLYDDRIVISYLEYAFKYANILKMLEDLLVPLRFSRSISRRVFNVDVGDLPSKRAMELMQEYQNKFKYKKFYNNETGEVSNQQHITTMVEDYWFANRNGSRGTEVTTIDESGNLGELNDILYFYKKLYKALNIPSNRIDINPDGNRDFSYDDTRTTLEELKFFAFISRIRKVYTDFLKEILRREIIATNVMSEQEFKAREQDIQIQFTNTNSFVEKMNLSNFNSKMEIFTGMIEQGGKSFPIRMIYEKVFGFNKNEVDDLMKEIGEESQDELLSAFYKKPDEDEF